MDELVDLSASGQRFRFFRNPGNIVMDCDGLERVIFHALGGVDQVALKDLTGTQVSALLLDLSNALGDPDTLADTILVNGTDTNDLVTITGSTNRVDVLGLTATLTIIGAEPDLDRLVISALGGTDTVDASAVDVGAIDLTLNGGPGNDLLLGGEGNDLLIGAQGADTAFGGAGSDAFLWDPGDGSDVFEGQADKDTLLFNGANVNELVNLSANGQRLRFFRSPGNITMDCHEVESVEFNALGGADTITIDDLSGTGVANVNLDLASVLNSALGDNQPDVVTVNGTSGNDAATITGTLAGISLLDLSATVSVLNSESALDQLVLRMMAGNDVAEASGLEAGVIILTLDGGPGNDVLFGSPGADTLLGGEGDDVLEGGPGLDVLDGGPGDNVVIQD